MIKVGKKTGFAIATAIGILLVFIAILTAYQFIKVSSKPFMYTSVKEIPVNKVGLLLGTSKFVSGGGVNLFYKYRIRATAALYQNNKIRYILVSGDNSTKNYNEPKKMRDDLIALGIPEDRIILDYAGFRTLDSVVRAKEVFGENEFTIISQPFHNERAVFLAKRFGINAIAYNAQNVALEYSLKTHIREYLARVKVFIDLTFGVEPKFLGEKISIPKNSN